MAPLDAATEPLHFSHRHDPEPDGCSLGDKLVIVLDRLAAGKRGSTGAFHVVPRRQRIEYTLDFPFGTLGKLTRPAHPRYLVADQTCDLLSIQRWSPLLHG